MDPNGAVLHPHALGDDYARVARERPVPGAGPRREGEGGHAGGLHEDLVEVLELVDHLRVEVAAAGDPVHFFEGLLLDLERVGTDTR